MKPTVTVLLDSRKAVGKSKKFPLKLRIGISKNDNRKYGLGRGFEFTKSEYQKLVKFRMKEPYKDIWIKIDALVRRADHIVEGLLPYFSYKDFKERFYDTKSFRVISDKTSLIAVRDLMINKYISNGQLPMSIKIKDSVESILKFADQENIPMRSITPTFCKKYEDYMYAKSKTMTRNGAGINMRHIRILFNEAINRKLIPRSWYPFKRESGEVSDFEDAYVIPHEGKIKTYLKEEEFLKFVQAKASSSRTQEHGRIAFLISYHCNGANAADFLRFKFRDIHGDFIVFYREKIKNASKADRKPVKIYMSDELKELILMHGNVPEPENYIFKCYTDEMTDLEKYHARTRFNGLASKSLKLFDLTRKISIGKARHTLVNRLKRNHVDREFVKDILGHTSIMTTDNYYDQFEDEAHREIALKFISVSKKGT